ncbi:MAG: hypothetical protein U5J64_01485 [Halobacteriales archaeon]|nr:hypothetical protein [Halobacteriales archaeon]
MTVSALWDNGDFVVSPSPDIRLDEHASLLVVGRTEKLIKEVERRVYSDTDTDVRVVVAGFGGESGR